MKLLPLACLFLFGICFIDKLNCTTVDGNGSKGDPVAIHAADDNHSNLGGANLYTENAKPLHMNGRRRFARDTLGVESVGQVLSLVNSQLNLHVKGKKGDTCKACGTAITLVKFMLLSNLPDEKIMKVASSLCLGLGMFTKEVCDGLIKLNGPPLLHIIKESELTPRQICSFLVKFDCEEEVIPEHMWRVYIPPRQRNGTQYQEHEASSKILKVLHISDTHFDPRYQEGAPDECILPLCCRADTPSASGNSSLSGKWGGWKCDIPEKTLDNLLEHIVEEHPDIDYVIWTGDIPPHDLWSMNRDESLMVLNQTTSKILKAFPNVPVYPALGNHEAVPPNLFPPSDVDEIWSVNWLYDAVEEAWSNWLPEDSLETVRLGAFYSVLNRPGLRIISLNTNFCHQSNWWLILNSTDPAQELKWLINTLLVAEKNGEKVQIIAHIPPGHPDCLKTWQTNYYDIIQRFSNTVAGQFFGHTHNDEFEIFYDGIDSINALNVAYIAPSVTTHTYLNPAYKIYYVGGSGKDTGSVIDHETWYMDLEEANKKGTPKWTKLYSARDAFNMTSLTPKDLHELYERLETEDDTFQSFYKFFWRDSPKRPECDEDCKNEILCGLRSCIQYKG